VHELSLNERGAAHEIIAQLEEAEDALDRIVFRANDLVGAATFERAAKLGAHRDAVAAVRTHLKAVVPHAESLFRAEQVAKGQIPGEREQSA
jgi:aspartyl/asparaginyl beta-hydroxylase (cupin superfamily)